MDQFPEKATAENKGADEVTLTGTIERFTFKNDDNGWAVVRFKPRRGKQLTLVGHLSQLGEGQEVKITGRESVHPRFGPQIDVRVAEAVVPGSVEGIRSYLASSLVKGIGPATAQRITDLFGEETLRIIEEEPEKLRQVRGLGATRIKELVAAIRAQKDIQAVMVFLRTHGLGQGLASRIVKRYGAGASALIQANPYRLADEVLGIGFRTADQLAGKMGLAPEACERIEAGLLHVLGLGGREGHCFLPQEDLVRRTAELLNLDEDRVTAEVPQLAAKGQVIRGAPPGLAVLRDSEDPVVYPLALYQAEVGCAANLVRLVREGHGAPGLDPNRALAWFQQRSGMTLPHGQLRALRQALEVPVSVITGGPGVGKTTIVRALTEIMARQHRTVRLAAPTGRAAKRLEESTGRSASTIHRLLEFQAGIGRFLRNDRNMLEGEMLVVDEASMLDIRLAYNLLRAVPASMQVVFVGDVDQLPAVGPGNVLGDMIESGLMPVGALTEIFRQKGDSSIVRAAHAVLQGEEPESGDASSDFFFVEARDPAHARALVRELVVHRIPKAFGLDPMSGIQVLCPMYRGNAGADALNKDLQETLNPGGDPVERAGNRFRPGDKVMQIRNDHDNEVYNGDVGRILSMDRGASRLVVSFGGRELGYRFDELDQLVPAYAISVHRSQGSEYPAVVLPLVTEHFMMLKRNLLYTAITRGKRLVVLVGSRKALSLAVRNHQETSRFSGLAERLREPLRRDGVHPERCQ